MTKLTKDDERAAQKAVSDIAAVRLAQLVGAAMALVAAWRGDWKGFLILAGLTWCLSLFLPRADPQLMQRLRDAAEPPARRK